MAILGISAHKTIIEHTQYVDLVNSEWLPDPVITAAMSGEVSGSGAAEAVRGAIISGGGTNLKQYYQYATRRFGKRNCKWDIKIINSFADNEEGLDRAKIFALIPSLKGKEVRVVQDNDTLSYSGTKSFYDVDTQLGWNDFTPPLPDGSNFVVTGAEVASDILKTDGSINLSTSWVLGIETSKNVPAVVLHPSVDESKILSPYYLITKAIYKPELSAGVSFWISANGFESSGTQINKEFKTYSNAPNDLNTIHELLKKYHIAHTIEDDTSGNPAGIGVKYLRNVFPNKVEIGRETDWEENVKLIVGLESISSAPDVDTPIEMHQPIEHVKVKYIQYKKTNVNTANPVIEFYDFEIWEEEGEIKYTDEDYIWVTKNNESHSGAKDYFKDDSKIDASQIGSSATDNWFKFYPYLPIKEDDQNILNYSKASKYLSALKQSEESNKDAEPSKIDVDAPKANRDGSREKTKKSRHSDLSSSVVRTLTGKSRYTRKIRPTGVRGIDKSDDRHLTKMGHLLNLDYKEIGSTLQNNENEDKIYHASILPSVTIGSNFDEVNEYWYTLFNRLSTKIGNSTYLNFIAAVNALSDSCTFEDVLKLPRTEINFGIENGQFSGGLSFAFIREFEIDGSIRNTKRKHSLKEIKSGLLAKLEEFDNGVDIKRYLIEPSKIMQEDLYVTSKAGKQYNIGGGSAYVDPKTDKAEPAPAGFSHTIHMINGGSKKDPPYKLGFTMIGKESDKAKLMFNKFGYTFFCKSIGHNRLHVIAVAGLIGMQITGINERDHNSTKLNGLKAAGTAWFELDLFKYHNKMSRIDNIPPDQIANLNWGAWEFPSFNYGNDRKRLKVTMCSFFVVPLDYKILIKMSGVSLLRFSDRAIMSYSWGKIKIRKLRGWVTAIIQIIGIIITIVGAIYGQPQYGMSILAAAKALAYAVIMQLVIKYGIALLVKVLGIKGIIATIVMVIIVVIAAMVGGQFANSSSLPYAHEAVTSQLASNLTSQATSSIQQNILDTLAKMVQDSIKQTISEITNMSATELAKSSMKLITDLAKGVNDSIAQETLQINKDLEAATKEYNEHMQELKELQELDKMRAAPYNIKEVMFALMNKTKLIDPSVYMTAMLAADNSIASEEFLSQFFNKKLSLEPTSFDSIESLDFSIQRRT